MAVGPSHVLGVVNSSIGAYDKTTGAIEAGLPEQSLKNFFGSATNTFDPKALYDQFSNRYLVVTLERVGNTGGSSASNESRILLAASPPGTPVGTWNAISINSKITEDQGTADPSDDVDYWCDYPGFAVDEEAIYITCNYFQFSGQPASLGTRLLTLNKSTLYAGTFNDATDLFLYDAVGSVGGLGLTMQPAQPHTNPGGTIGTWLSAFSGLSDGTNEFLQIIRVDNPLAGAGASFTGGFVNVGDLCPGRDCFGYSNASQQGATTTLQANDPRTLDAEWRSGGLWLTATLNPNGAESGQATAHWWRVETSTLGTSSVTVNQGSIGGEELGAGTSTFFPSIAVNDNCAVVGFAASNSAIFPGGYYAAIDLNTFEATPIQVAKAGEATYEAFDGSPYRWGDYTGTEVDFTSAGDADMWVFQEYTPAPATPGGTSQWSTYFAKDNCLGALPVELDGFGAVQDGEDVLLTWRTLSETVNYGFEIERKTAGSTFVSVGFVEGAGTTLSSRSYRFRDETPAPGRYIYRLKQVDLDGAFDFGPEVSTFVGLAADYELSQAAPNPASGRTSFSITVKNRQQVLVEVYDLLGRRIARLHDGQVDANQSVLLTLETNELPAGTYVYRAVGETFVASGRVTVTR